MSASSWCGPFSEYSDYIDFINYDNDSDIANMPSYGNWYDAWKRFAHVWLCAVVFVVIGKFIHFDYFTTSGFVAEPLYYKVFLLCLSMQSEMFKLFCGFTAMEANLIASGMSYRRKTEKTPETYNHLR